MIEIGEKPGPVVLSTPFRGLVELLCGELAVQYGTMTARLEVDYHAGEPSMIRLSEVEKLYRLR